MTSKEFNNLDRRKFVSTSVGALASLSALGSESQHTAMGNDFRSALPLGKADSCIFIWLGGGACHVDTFDPKRIGDPKQKNKKPGSAYKKIPTAIQGEFVCEHLPKLAERMDKGVLLRSLHHNVIDEHAAAVNRMHVGRPSSGTTIYPSLGSMIIHERPTSGLSIPSYVLMGYPSATRGPGFLGNKHGYVYLTNTTAGPSGLKLPSDVTAQRMKRRQKLLQSLSKEQIEQNKNSKEIKRQLEYTVAGLKLAGPKFMSNFDLSTESDDLRNAYGDEFGQRCLLARRLVQSGIRFTEVCFNLNFINGTGWDTHNEGQQNQHVLIRQLDQALSTLIDDLEKRSLLDKTLIVVATEFGRPPEFDAGGGRGHQSTAFSGAMFGGGLKTGQVIGQTDELGKKILSNPISIPDFHATIFKAMGIDHKTELYDGDRPVPITDHGKPIAKLFA